MTGKHDEIEALETAFVAVLDARDYLIRTRQSHWTQESIDAQARLDHSAQWINARLAVLLENNT